MPQEKRKPVYTCIQTYTHTHTHTHTLPHYVQMDAVASTEEKSKLTMENEKLKKALETARQRANKAASAAEKSASKSDEAEWKAREDDLHRQIRDMSAVQKRLDFALNHALREKDTALADAADKEEQLRNSLQQKRVLQMQLHSLGSGKGAARTDRSDMLCFFCEDERTGQIEVQFVDTGISWAEFADVLQRCVCLCVCVSVWCVCCTEHHMRIIYVSQIEVRFVDAWISWAEFADVLQRCVCVCVCVRCTSVLFMLARPRCTFVRTEISWTKFVDVLQGSVFVCVNVCIWVSQFVEQSVEDAIVLNIHTETHSHMPV
jgi:hypothetical protein